MVAFGIYVELTVRTQRGSGFKRFLGNLFYSNEIDSYRNLAFHFLFFAPALFIFGFGIWLATSWMRNRSDQKVIKEEIGKLKPNQQKALVSQGLSTRRLAKELIKMKADKSNGQSGATKRVPANKKATKRSPVKGSTRKIPAAKTKR